MGERLAYYDLIGVPPDASNEELKAAMRRSLRYWHPDRNARPDALQLASHVLGVLDPLSAADCRGDAESGLPT